MVKMELTVRQQSFRTDDSRSILAIALWYRSYGDHNHCIPRVARDWLKCHSDFCYWLISVFYA